MFELTNKMLLNPITMQRLMGMAKHSLKKKIIVSDNQKICCKSKVLSGRFLFNLDSMSSHEFYLST